MVVSPKSGEDEEGVKEGRGKKVSRAERKYMCKYQFFLSHGRNVKIGIHRERRVQRNQNMVEKMRGVQREERGRNIKWDTRQLTIKIQSRGIKMNSINCDVICYGEKNSTTSCI